MSYSALMVSGYPMIRFSWSDFVGAWDLFLAGGRATSTVTRRSVAGAPHDYQARMRTKEALKYPAVVFNGQQAQSVANGFAQMAETSGYRIHACSILPQHVHLVIGRHKYKVESVVRLLKGQASRMLEDDNRHPLAQFKLPDDTLPTPWASKCWKAFLNTPEDIQRAIVYVENNPIKDGKRAQKWRFVVPYIPVYPHAPFSRVSKGFRRDARTLEAAPRAHMSAPSKLHEPSCPRRRDSRRPRTTRAQEIKVPT